MGGGPGGGAMAIGGGAGGGAIAAGGGAVCWAQAASARTAPSTYRCFIVNPPGLMKSALAFAGTGFFDARLRKSSGRFAERPLCPQLLIKEKAPIFPGPILSPQTGRGGSVPIANRRNRRSRLTSDASYFRCFRRNSYAGWCDTSVLRLALSK